MSLPHLKPSIRLTSEGKTFNLRMVKAARAIEGTGNSRTIKGTGNSRTIEGTMDSRTIEGTVNSRTIEGTVELLREQ